MSCLNNIFTQRRSIYNIGNNISVTDIELENIIKNAIKNVPSAFNSQSSRVVLLLGKNHLKLWNDITLNTLKNIINEEKFKKTKDKIQSFANGYGTVLFYEDLNIINNLKNKFPEYKNNYTIWSNQTSAMLQYMLWTLFTEKNIGASLQHYNPLIDNIIAEEFNIDKNWSLVAQMPFGNILQPANKKTTLNINNKIRII